MHLHIGGTKIIPGREIIGIFNMKIQDKACNREFLQYTQTENVGDEKASFVVTDEKVYFSPIAPATLLKRLKDKTF
jgi:hypothetical protein